MRTLTGVVGNGIVKQCLSITDASPYREDCVALHVLWTARREKDRELCESIPSHMEDIAAICQDLFAGHVAPSEIAEKQAIPQIDMHNVFLVSNGAKSFTDRAVEMGVAVTGWSWAAKFADVDNDEWQDLYPSSTAYSRVIGGSPMSFSIIKMASPLSSAPMRAD